MAMQKGKDAGGGSGLHQWGSPRRQVGELCARHGVSRVWCCVSHTDVGSDALQKMFPHCKEMQKKPIANITLL